MAEPLPSPPAPPALFSAEGTAVLPDHPAFLGGRCGHCGNMFFPMQRYGCEKCGSVDLHDTALTGRGKLLTTAKVHVHASPDRIAPFTIGCIVTDDGAFVRAIVDPDVADRVTIDDVMVTKLVPETRPGLGEFDLRLTSEGDA